MLKLRKNLRDSFAMALEEMENVVGGEIVGQTDEEIKILEEEAVKQGVEIQQDLAAVEECCADIETLQEQLGENDKKLTDPDIVVTAVDVEVSEECYKGMAFKYGVKNPNSIRFSHESVLDAVKAEPRRYLAMSSEGIKEFIIKIWEKIKAFFRKIGEKLGLINKVEEVKSKKAEEKLEEAKKEIEKMPEATKNKKIKVLKPKKPSKKKVSKESYKYGVSLEEVTGEEMESSAIGVFWVIASLAAGRKDVFTELTNAKRTLGICRSAVNILGKVQNRLANGADPKSDKEVSDNVLKAVNMLESIHTASGNFISKYAKYFEDPDGQDSSARIYAVLHHSIVGVRGTEVDCLLEDSIESALNDFGNKAEMAIAKLYKLPSEKLDELADTIEPKEQISPKMMLDYINILSKTHFNDYKNEINALTKDIDSVVSDANVNFSPTSETATAIRALAIIMKTVVKYSGSIPRTNRVTKEYFDLMIQYAKENDISLDS